MSTKKISFKSDLKQINETLNNNSSIDLDKEKNKKFNILSSSEISTKYTISKRKSKLSILSGDNKFSNNFPANRFDAFGNEINKKGNKNYKVSFIDQISSEKIAEVFLIDDSYFKNNNNKEKEICKCSTCFIF